MLIEKIRINTNSITATFNTGGNYISINMTGVQRACRDAEVGRPALLSAQRSPDGIVSKLHKAIVRHQLARFLRVSCFRINRRLRSLGISLFIA